MAAFLSMSWMAANNHLEEYSFLLKKNVSLLCVCQYIQFHLKKKNKYLFIYLF